jgi:hypothetical protein
MSDLTLISEKVATLTIESESTKLSLAVNKTNLTISQAGAQGQAGVPGQGVEVSEASYGLFERAGIASKDDDLFPNLITKSDYNGLTGATQVINRNISNNLIIDSIVDTYDYLALHYVWTTPYLGGTDLLANRKGTPSVVIT